jgi:hypothetical protein
MRYRLVTDSLKVLDCIIQSPSPRYLLNLKNLSYMSVDCAMCRAGPKPMLERRRPGAQNC